MAVALDGQYRAVREEAGFALLERGWIRVTGTDAADYLQGQLTNDIEALAPGSGAYSALLDRKGRMQADMRVLRLGAGEILIEVEPQALSAATRHLQMYSVGREVEVSALEGSIGLIAVAGPATASLTGLPPLAAENDHTEVELDGSPARAVRTAAGLDLIAEASELSDLERALESHGVDPVSEGALEIVRVESGRPRFGHEMTQETIPQEAGINERAVSFTKGCYIGQETVARLHYKGKPNRHLRGLRLDSPVAAGSVVTLGERELGKLGTAVLSPAHGPIALAVLRREAAPGDEVLVDGEITAKVVDLPFDE